MSGGGQKAVAPAVEDWEAIVAGAGPKRHIAQLYTEHEFLARAVGRFARDGVRSQDGILLIATPLHRLLILRRLEGLGVDVKEMQRRGQLLVREADETLGKFMVGGRPDREAFRGVIGGVLDELGAAGYGRVRAFGEMVDRLRARDFDAAIELEELWNELLAERATALLCAYSVDALDARSSRGLVPRIAGVHSDLIPVEDFAKLDRAVDRAYVEIFGSHEDAQALRQAFLEHFVRPAAMPDAAAAVLAMQSFVPDSADALIASVRRHYYSLPA